MRKAVCILLVFIFCCGCTAASPQSSAGETPGILIEPPVGDALEEYRLEDASAVSETVSVYVVQPSSGDRYYANKNSKKFHTETCYYAGRIKEENLRITTDRNALIAEGYTPCKECTP